MPISSLCDVDVGLFVSTAIIACVFLTAGGMAQIRAGTASGLRPGDQIVFKPLVLVMAVEVGMQNVGNR